MPTPVIPPLPHIADATPTLSVADVLQLSEITEGDPELIAGHAHTTRAVRWAHVLAGTSAAALLDGDELILTTGAGWPAAHPQLTEFAHALAAARPAAVVLELSEQLPAAPEALIEHCDAQQIPLIVLHREVRFVQITQRVHQRILAAHTEALQARADVHAMLTELGLNRSPVDYVVEQLAQTLNAPVVLEDSSQRVIAWAAQDRNPATILAPWAATPSLTQPHADPPGDRVAVEAQGKRWGVLTALPGPSHPAGRRTVLELGAFALALGRLADDNDSGWLQLSSKALFRTIFDGKYRRDTDLATQLEAAGLPLTGRTLVGATLRGVGAFGGHATLERAVLETAFRRAVAPHGRVILTPDPDHRDPLLSPPLLLLVSLPQQSAGSGSPALHASAHSGRSASHAPSPVAAAAPLVAADLAADLAARLAHELDMLVPAPTPAAWRAHLALGAPSHSVRGLITSLERVRAAGRISPHHTVGRVTVQQAERQALAYLLQGLSAAPEVHEYATEMLRPLIEHDAGSGPGHSGDLLTALRAYVQHPTNRSLAAAQSRLSRSVFYQRLALIEELLDVQLSDGETIASLAVALLIRGEVS